MAKKSSKGDFNKASGSGIWEVAKFVALGVVLGGVADYLLFHGPVADVLMSKLMPWGQAALQATGIDHVFNWTASLVPAFPTPPAPVPAAAALPASLTTASLTTAAATSTVTTGAVTAAPTTITSGGFDQFLGAPSGP